ncbi:hypothetical protein L1987_06665 [Smallanthus sonchifolius]|uniref:Uncharacterized protein n=1 Tax=Smallanthus sonchifolius TaxID=185202 RepID=A0ACB9JYZ1_9ASTR|nr:hypothetical protein L1987_06665 [Smallanthus sonchifolius]
MKIDLVFVLTLITPNLFKSWLEIDLVFVLTLIPLSLSLSFSFSLVHQVELKVRRLAFGLREFWLKVLLLRCCWSFIPTLPCLCSQLYAQIPFFKSTFHQWMIIRRRFEDRLLT